MLIEIANVDDRGRLFDLEEKRLHAQRLTTFICGVVLWDVLHVVLYAVRNRGPYRTERDIVYFDVIVLLFYLVLAAHSRRTQTERRTQCIQTGQLDMYSSSWASFVSVMLVLISVMSGFMYALYTHRI